MITILLTVTGLAIGAFVGRSLAQRGITGATALEGRQGIALVVVFLAGVAGLLLYFRHKFPWLPTMPAVYAEAALVPTVLLVASTGLGLLVFMEWSGRHDKSRLRSLIVSAVFLFFCLGFLWFWMMPVDRKLGPSAILDGVVIQTTPYTCAPASIATLTRHVLGDNSATERTLVALTRTTRGGTSTLDEIRAMRAAGLGARFATGLTMDSLVASGSFALLHVDEPVAGTTIRHAIALLHIDPVAQTVVVGNPLHGRQIKRFDEMEGYWLGETVFVDRSPEGN